MRERTLPPTTSAIPIATPPRRWAELAELAAGEDLARRPEVARALGDRWLSAAKACARAGEAEAAFTCLARGRRYAPSAWRYWRIALAVRLAAKTSRDATASEVR
jgi:hypothetical protein